MPPETQEQSFLDGFAVGELTGRLKHEAPLQLKQWVSLAKLKDFRSLFQKHNYSITGVTAHPSDPNRVQLTAEKIATGTNPNLIQAFAQGDRFMDGWEAGCIAGQLRYAQPDRVEEWVRVENLDAIQQVIDDCGYTITTMRIHPEYKKWTLVVAERSR